MPRRSRGEELQLKIPLLLAEASLKTIERSCVASGQILLAIDYDGALLDGADAQSDGTLPESTRECLRRLASRPHIDIVLLSGRTLKELQKLVKLKEVALGAVHGLELFDGGEREAHDDFLRAERIIETTIEEMGGKIEGWNGVKIENRRVTLCVHHPTISRKDAEGLAAHLVERLEGERVQIVQARRTIEILPDIAWDRSLAVRRFMERHRRLGTFPLLICAGDYPFDIPSLRMTRDMSGIAIGIGRDAARSGSYVAEGPGDLVRFLEILDGWMAAKAAVA